MVFVVVALVGCGPTGTTAGTVSTSAVATTTTVPGAPIGEIVVRRGTKDEFCAAARKTHSTLASVFSSDNTEANDVAWRTVEDGLRRLLSAVPGDLLDEARLIAENAVSYLRLVQRFNGDMSALSADVNAVDSVLRLTANDDVAMASDQLDRFMRNKCGIQLGSG